MSRMVGWIGQLFYPEALRRRWPEGKPRDTQGRSSDRSHQCHSRLPPGRPASCDTEHETTKAEMKPVDPIRRVEKTCARDRSQHTSNSQYPDTYQGAATDKQKPPWAHGLLHLSVSGTLYGNKYR